MVWLISFNSGLDGAITSCLDCKHLNSNSKETTSTLSVMPTKWGEPLLLPTIPPAAPDPAPPPPLLLLPFFFLFLCFLVFSTLGHGSNRNHTNSERARKRAHKIKKHQEDQSKSEALKSKIVILETLRINIKLYMCAYDPNEN